MAILYDDLQVKEDPINFTLSVEIPNFRNEYTDFSNAIFLHMEICTFFQSSLKLICLVKKIYYFNAQHIFYVKLNS